MHVARAWICAELRWRLPVGACCRCSRTAAGGSGVLVVSLLPAGRSSALATCVSSLRVVLAAPGSSLSDRTSLLLLLDWYSPSVYGESSGALVSEEPIRELVDCCRVWVWRECGKNLNGSRWENKIMSESSRLWDRAGGFWSDAGGGGDWVHYCCSVAHTAELLLCFTVDVTSCVLWLWPGAGGGISGHCSRLFRCIACTGELCCRGFLSICLGRLLVLEQSRCALRRAVSVFLFPLVGSFFALSCWCKPSKVILATSHEVNCCSSEALVFLESGIV